VARQVKYHAWLFMVVLCAATACKAYDPSLVEVREHQKEAGSTGSTAGMSGNAGGSAGAAAGAGGIGNAAGVDDDGGIPPDVPRLRCGNGIIDSGERCDIAIPAGMPGACPVTCQAPASCQRVSLVGRDCDAECQLVRLGCIGGDSCCPADCTPERDSDCSGQCGDGIVQAELGETCENSNADARCPTLSDCTDQDACTHDAISGSAENCNAACTHTPITALQNEDGCCPPGADANTDSDCKPQCGNKIRESGEECDGSTGCDANCKLTLTPEQITCLDTIAKNDCQRCTCMQCAEQVAACSASDSPTRDAKCTAVEKCAEEKQCSGQTCFCGNASLVQCAFFPNGPCTDVIVDAAGSSNPAVTESQRQDPNTALGRAQALGDCRRAQCRSECS
jgi:hypothetical protein